MKIVHTLKPNNSKETRSSFKEALYTFNNYNRIFKEMHKDAFHILSVL